MTGFPILVFVVTLALQRVDIPSTARGLEGVPAVRIDSTAEQTTRRVLSKAEADEHRVKVDVVDGRYYLAGEKRPLQLTSSGGFTYLSAEPGRYIRFRKLNDRISYVEHIDMASGSVTYWGELRIVVGR
jgi:hypothetical protein